MQLFYNDYQLYRYSCILQQLDEPILGKVAYLNVLRSK